MVRQQPTRVRCPSRLRERRDCSQSLFFKFSWTSGMLPGLTTLNLKVKFSERLREDLQNSFSSKDSLAAVGACAGAPAMWMEVRAAQCSADFLRGTVTTLKKICRNA